MKKSNFIIVRLGDNDFGYPLHNALRDLVDTLGINFCPTLAKTYIVEYVTSYSIRLSIQRGLTEDGIETERKRLKEYLSSITVLINDSLPTYEPDGMTINDDGGSVYYDINLGKVFFL